MRLDRKRIVEKDADSFSNRIGKDGRRERIMAEIFNDDNFNQEVMQAKEPVLVDFFADWCNPCKKIAPLIAELAEEYKGRMKICKVNVDESPNSTNKFHILAVPTMLILVNGELKERIEGANVTKQELISKIESVI